MAANSVFVLREDVAADQAAAAQRPGASIASPLDNF
jgi:hypothetical protein